MMESIDTLVGGIAHYIEIRQDIQSQLGTILADPTQIHLVMMNLCTNANNTIGSKPGTIREVYY